MSSNGLTILTPGSAGCEAGAVDAGCDAAGLVAAPGAGDESGGVDGREAGGDGRAEGGACAGNQAAPSTSALVQAVTRDIGKSAQNKRVRSMA